MRPIALLVSAAAVALCTAPAFGHAGEPTSTDETSDSEAGIGDNVVTAERREESSQRAVVPLSGIDGSTMLSAALRAAELRGYYGQ